MAEKVVSLDCIDCQNHVPVDEPCPMSEKACGHHCNHSWTHDRCCWCKTHWGEGGETTVEENKGAKSTPNPE